MADAPFMPLAMGGRTGGARPKSDIPSSLPPVHWGPFGGGGCLLRGAELGHPLRSPAAGIEFPFGCASEVTVEVDEIDDVDDTDDEEFVR